MSDQIQSRVFGEKIDRAMRVLAAAEVLSHEVAMLVEEAEGDQTGGLSFVQVSWQQVERVRDALAALDRTSG